VTVMGSKKKMFQQWFSRRSLVSAIDNSTDC